MAAQPDPFCPMTVLADRLRSGEVTPTDAVETYLDRIDTVDGEINAYVTVTDEVGREAAGEAETALADGADLGPLHGVPIALKDLRDTKAGVPHSFGSKLIGDLGYVADEREHSKQRSGSDLPDDSASDRRTEDNAG